MKLGKTKKIIIGVLAAVVLLIGGWFAFFRNQAEKSSLVKGEVVAKVNGEKITSDEVTSVQEMFNQQGQQISDEEALDQIINQKLIVQKAKKEGYTVSAEEAEKVIEEQLAMQEMNLDEFKDKIADQGLSYEEQLEYMKEELAIQNYLENEIGEEVLEVSDEETDEFYQRYQEEQPEDEEMPSFEELEPQIIALLQQQKQQEAINGLIEELRQTAQIDYL